MIRRTLIGLIALISSAAQANYFTYQQWLAMNETARVLYISGAYDSFVTILSDEQSVTNSSYFKKCIQTAQMTNAQLAANVLNFAKDRPELHTDAVQTALLGYLIAACGKPPTL